MLQMFVLALSLYNTWNRGVFLLCKITNLLIYSLLKEEIEQARKTTDFSFTHCLERLYEDKRSEYELVYRLKKDPMLEIKPTSRKVSIFQYLRMKKWL